MTSIVSTIVIQEKYTFGLLKVLLLRLAENLWLSPTSCWLSKYMYSQEISEISGTLRRWKTWLASSLIFFTFELLCLTVKANSYYYLITICKNFVWKHKYVMKCCFVYCCTCAVYSIYLWSMNLVAQPGMFRRLGRGCDILRASYGSNW